MKEEAKQLLDEMAESTMKQRSKERWKDLFKIILNKFDKIINKMYSICQLNRNTTERILVAQIFFFLPCQKIQLNTIEFSKIVQSRLHV